MSIRPSEFGLETDSRTGLEVDDDRLEVDDDHLVVDRAGLEVDGDCLGVEEVDRTGLDLDCLEEATTAA